MSRPTNNKVYISNLNQPSDDTNGSNFIISKIKSKINSNNPSKKYKPEPERKDAITNSNSPAITNYNSPTISDISTFSRRNANCNLNLLNMNDLNNEIEKIYKQTTAYSLENGGDISRWRGENNLSNRFKRLYNAKYTITHQSKFEKFNTFLTILMGVISLVLIYYIYNYQLELAPRDTIDYNAQIEEHKHELAFFKKLKLVSYVIQGFGYTYLFALTLRRLYKRSTQAIQKNCETDIN